ncbi:MAG: MoxR family ATPase [Deltaproteobacteria bacterium]|nr:MoxR family ATPase [Deltaproteobacteria bacterium]
MGSSADLPTRLTAAIGKALRGKDEVVQLAVVTLLARGHLLIEDVPGVGKTTLARAVAACVGLTFRRLQFTSDLMPTDVLGGNVFDRDKGEFVFRPGPVFTQLLLADEINRTTPRTQSALLEAMDEGRVSIDGVTHALEDPFFVIATQNPQDFHGTYPLPESQLDRFLIRTEIGYPPPEVERAVLETRRRDGDPIAALEAIVTLEELRAAQAQVDEIRVEPLLIDYLHDLVLATRKSSLIEIGASTRAALALERAVRARALVEGRDHVLPDDVKALAEPVLAHRIRPVVSNEGRGDAKRAIRSVVDELSVPL